MHVKKLDRRVKREMAETVYGTHTQNTYMCEKTEWTGKEQHDYDGIW